MFLQDGLLRWGFLNVNVTDMAMQDPKTEVLDAQSKAQTLADDHCAADFRRRQSECSGPPGLNK